MHILLILLIVLLLCGGVPAYRNRADWGYGPAGGLGFVLLILVILLLLGRI